MSGLRTALVGSLSLLLGACCCGGEKPATADSGSSSAAAKTAKVQMADPARIKSVKKVALVSISADCDYKDDTGQAGTVLGGISALSGKNDDMRTGKMLDGGAPAFAAAVSSAGVWTIVPLQEMTANPAYAANTFSADLHEQVKETRKALGCAGGGYRVLTRDYTDRAGTLAAALGVDAVALTQLSVTLEYAERGVHARGRLNTISTITLVGPDGMTLMVDHPWAQSTDTIPMTVGKLDWAQVPPMGPSLMRELGRKFAADVRAAQTKP
ncbi:MAG TPA: hypothetical protein VMV18_14125 [bacterium]|nr:hypothetical protein [bacterium]